MRLVIASDFMEAALATMIIPLGVFISLIVWLARSSRRFSSPVHSAPAATADTGTAVTPPSAAEASEPRL
jgi:hypothetical protein